MKVKIFWKNKESEKLYNKVVLALEELWITDFIELEKSTDKKLVEELNIKKDFALIVEEESIDFVDMIFEWIIPDDHEIKSMFISIIWWEWNIGCDTSMCGSWCNMC